LLLFVAANHGREKMRPRDPSPEAQDDGFLELRMYKLEALSHNGMWERAIESLFHNH